MSALIELKNLSLSYGDDKVISNLSFSVKKGEFIGVVGSNGSGKSTLAYLIASVIPNLIRAKLSGSFKARTAPGLVLQNPDSQFISMTVKEELSHAMETTATKPVKSLIRHLMQRSVFDLSEGEKQRVNLVSNLGFGELLLLDEPLELLDPASVREFLKLINWLIGKTTIVWFDKNTAFLKKAHRIIYLSKTKKEPVPRAPKPLKKKSANSSGELIRLSLTNYAQSAQSSFKLKNIRLRLRMGEKIALIGNNGAGKTTLLKIIAGVLSFDGSVWLKQGAVVSYSPQNPSHLLFEDSVEKELLAAPIIGALSSKQRGIKRLAAELRLEKLLKKEPSKLSKGQQKLVSIAASAYGDIILLDEPTTWLDEDNARLVYSYIANSDKSMIIATHDKRLLSFVDKVFLLDNGGLIKCSGTRLNRFFQTGM